jgi:hypothetical protein
MRDNLVFEKVDARTWSALAGRGPVRGADIERLVLGEEPKDADACVCLPFFLIKILFVSI